VKKPVWSKFHQKNPNIMLEEQSEFYFANFLTRAIERLHLKLPRMTHMKVIQTAESGRAEWWLKGLRLRDRRKRISAHLYTLAAPLNWVNIFSRSFPLAICSLPAGQLQPHQNNWPRHNIMACIIKRARLLSAVRHKSESLGIEKLEGGHLGLDHAFLDASLNTPSVSTRLPRSTHES
jgi:hypothetical protein